MNTIRLIVSILLVIIVLDLLCVRMYGGVCLQEHKVKGCVGEWEDAKKYKSEVGSWQNFSWKEPTEENGGVTLKKN